uniref:Uncharacterized protein n=1 Tax=Ditylenchus dipsaci TaxID=166011 RepID=A0A915E1Z3_9BILA
MNLDINWISWMIAFFLGLSHQQHTGKGQFTLKLIQFIQQLQGKGYTELVMYTNQNDWNGLVSRDSDEIFSHMPLWVYDFKETGLPDDIETWTSRGKTWKFWHFSNTTQIDGIYNCVNADVEQ